MDALTVLLFGLFLAVTLPGVVFLMTAVVLFVTGRLRPAVRVATVPPAPRRRKRR